jgi:hypothetical protein
MLRALSFRGLAPAVSALLLATPAAAHVPDQSRNRLIDSASQAVYVIDNSLSMVDKLDGTAVTLERNADDTSVSGVVLSCWKGYFAVELFKPHSKSSAFVRVLDQ